MSNQTVYYPTIGIECHVQLNTKTKLFSSVSNESRDAAPNSLISHIDAGLPGALPVLNAKAVDLACRVAYALNTVPQRFSKFDRKHYFYPDLPKGYQISQYDQPIIKGGYITIMVDGTEKQIGINRVHLEEDAGKNSHPAGADYSLVDLNRAGTPLLELVSEPEIYSAAEAKAFARELYLIMKFAGVTDGDLYHGNIRFDVNISISADKQKLGTRSEVKNLNSFKSVEAAVEYEIKRQSEVLSKGELVVQETRGWDESKQKTTAQRGKEEAHDYRYFPEPDLPPIELNDNQLEEAKTGLPKMPWEWRRQLLVIGLDEAVIETLLEAEVESQGVKYLSLIDAESDKDRAKTYANWTVNIIVPLQREGFVTATNDTERSPILKAVYDLYTDKKIHSNGAKAMLGELLRIGKLPDNFERWTEEQGYMQISDENQLREMAEKVISANPKAAADIKNGESKAIGYLVGQVMQKSAGKANPAAVKQMIEKIILGRE